MNGKIIRKDTEKSNSLNEKYSSILLCGGKGTRLSDRIGRDNQKSLFKLANKELITYSIELMNPSIVNKLVFAVAHRADQVEKWVESINLPYEVTFSRQKTPGIIGAIKSAKRQIEDNKIILCNSDEIRINLDLKSAIRFHEKSGLLATVIGGYTNKLYKEAVLEIENEDGIVSKIKNDDQRYLLEPEKIGLVSVGILIMNKNAIDYFDTTYDINWNGILQPLVKIGQLNAYINPKIIFCNVNTSDQIENAETYLKQQATHC